MLNRTDTGRGEPFRILMVDDSQDMLAYHAAWLEAAGMVVSKVDDPLRLFDLLSETNPDVLILDMYMPQCSGFEVARVLRMRDEFLSLPIMFLSVESDLSRQGQALSAGGDDFFTKPVQPNAFIAAVATRARRARALKAQMVHDGLTGLFNHTSIETALHQEVTRAARGGETIVASMVDIDLFKRVNDTYGHAAGDDVLRALSRLLRHRLRKTDVIGRYGGEEFLIILPGTTLEKAGHVIDELREGFSQLVHQCGDRLFSCTFSAGVAKLCMGESAAEMLKRADDALYKSKNGGRNRITLASDSAPS